MTDVERKLSAARTRLIIDKPFLGALTLRLPMKAANPEWCHTTATDAKCFFYNPDYIASLSLQQTQFILAHDALHCALSHFARRQHRIKHRWDIACDFAINPLLTQEGLEAPPGALIEASYEGMTAEEIYPYIQENSEQTTLDKHVYDEQNENDSDLSDTKARQLESAKQTKPTEPQDPGDPKTQPGSRQLSTENQGVAPPPLSESEREQLQVQWQQRMAGAAQQAMQAGKMGGAMERMIDHLLQPQLPWRSLLAHFVSSAARDDYSYSRPNTRRGEPAIYPSLRSEEIDMVVVLDTSGSISETEMQEFLGEVNAIKSQIRARLIFHACDAVLADDGPWVYESWENFELPRHFVGGGATDFTPVFQWLEQQDKQPQLLVYFTDAKGTFPESMPECPVIWLVKGKAQVPWGQRVQLN